MKKPENRCPEMCLLPCIKAGKPGKGILAYFFVLLTAANIFDGFFFFFSSLHLIHRIWSLA